MATTAGRTRLALVALLLEHASHRPALVRGGILHDAVGLAPLVILREVLGDRHAFRVDEEQAVAVLPLLHLLAGADPPPELGLFLGVRIEVAGAERTTNFFDMPGKALDHGLGPAHVGMETRAGFRGGLAGVGPL